MHLFAVCEQAVQLDCVPPSEYVIEPHSVQVPALESNLNPALHCVHFPFVLSQTEQEEEQEVQVIAVPPVEYVIELHSIHFPSTKIYPALHDGQIPVDVEQVVQPSHSLHIVSVPPNEYVKEPQALHLPSTNLYPA